MLHDATTHRLPVKVGILLHNLRHGQRLLVQELFLLVRERVSEVSISAVLDDRLILAMEAMLPSEVELPLRRGTCGYKSGPVHPWMIPQKLLLLRKELGVLLNV